MRERLFGTDGVRGVANKYPMDAETALKLGRAIVRFASRDNKTHNILVGRDTRVSGPMLESALAAGICSMGANAVLAGIIPTPGIAFLTRDLRCDAGVVISASHNPYEDNGIKFFDPDGFKLSDQMEDAIEEMLGPEKETYGLTSSCGTTRFLEDAVGRYLVYLKSSLPKKFHLAGIKIVVDSANGAGFKAAPMILRELGANVFEFASEPNGTNINEHCGSLHPETLRKLVLNNGAHLGIALDGDADRVILVDDLGNQINGDQVMGLIAKYLKNEGLLSKNTLVSTVMSNIGLESAMRQAGIALIRTPVGDRYVVERMRNDGFNFGGEQSGHIIFLDHSTSGDGILTALQVMRVIAETGVPLSDAAKQIPMYPQLLKNIVVNSRKNLDEIPEVRDAIETGRQRLGNNGRLLVRYSGTQLLCRVMAEGESEAEIREIVDTVAEVISLNV